MALEIPKGSPLAGRYSAVGWWLSGREPVDQALGIAASGAALFALLFVVDLGISRRLVGLRLRIVGRAVLPAFAAGSPGPEPGRLPRQESGKGVRLG